MTNYGVNLELEKQQQSEKDWVFGAMSVSSLFLIPFAERIKYLPSGEVQKSRFGDMSDCATRAPINLLEAEFTYAYQNNLIIPENMLFLEQNGYIQDEKVLFSDAFIAILSGTTRIGNSLKGPLDAIYKNGLVPKIRLPLNSDMTWDQYHDPKRITQDLLELGKQFKERFSINFDQVKNDKFVTANEDGMIVVAGHAWPPQIDGIYIKTDEPFNHAWLNVQPKFVAFDNYTDLSNSFIKNLDPEYKFWDYGYRVFVSSQQIPLKPISLFERIIYFLKQNLPFSTI